MQQNSDDDATCWQTEKDDRRISGLKNQFKHTPTLSEQYSRFIPAQVTHLVTLNIQYWLHGRL